MSQRLVITGMGAVTPVGIGVDAYWQGLLAGRCGIDEITRVSTEGLPVTRAAEVHDFCPRDHLSVRLAADLDPFMQFAYVAAEQALRQSGLDPAGPRTGIVMGTAVAGMTLTGETQRLHTVCGEHVSPRFVSKTLGNIAAAQLAITYHIQGPSLTVSTACSSGGDAIVMAWMMLNCGVADAVVVMAGETAVSPLFIESMARAGALSKTASSRPFDAARDGFVIGEGGGALVIETLEGARARGATILAELLGCADNNDAHHPVSPLPDGTGAAACMRLALSRAGLRPDQIGYLNAHGTATQRGDAAEAAAIRLVFGDYAVPVSSTKGATGHMMGAGGITEVIACIRALETDTLPFTIGFTEPDDETRSVNLIAGQAVHTRIDAAMSNALGFGGQNSSIIVGRCR